jgi:hypothetical protein
MLRAYEQGDEEKLRSTILEPWMRGRVIPLGDKEWEPKDCKLIILEGPELGNTDLSMGRGWANAERSSENVTRRLVDEAMVSSSGPVVAVLAEDASAEAAITGMLERLELETVPWRELRARIMAASTGGPGYAAILAVGDRAPSPTWLFDAGLARGALGAMAVVVQLGEAAIPSQLAGGEVMRVEPAHEASVRALGGRLGR